MCYSEILVFVIIKNPYFIFFGMLSMLQNHICNIYQMQRCASLLDDTIWEQQITRQLDAPTHFRLFEQLYDIKKLELHKLHPSQVELKIKEWPQKRENIPAHKFKHWMENQYRIFIWLLLCLIDQGHPIDSYDSHQWSQIGNLFNRDGIVCQYFYLISKKTKCSPWSAEQDQILQQMMNTDVDEIKWTEIGVRLFEKSNRTRIHQPKAIRDRWLNKLNPAIIKSKWSAEQDLKLLSYTEIHGKKWAKISKVLGNRNQHTIKNRYHQLIVRKLNKIKAAKGSNLTEERLVSKNIKQLQQKILGEGTKEISEDCQNCERLNHQTQMKMQPKTRKFMPIVIKDIDFHL